MFNQTEEDFLLSCVQEVFKVWSSHGKADLNISVNNGQAAVHLDFQLREPKHLNSHMLVVNIKKKRLIHCLKSKGLQ